MIVALFTNFSGIVDVAAIDPSTMSAEEQLVTALTVIGDGRQGARGECIFFIASVDRVREHIRSLQREGGRASDDLHRLHDRAGRLYPGVSRRLLGQAFEDPQWINQARPDRGEPVQLFAD